MQRTVCIGGRVAVFQPRYGKKERKKERKKRRKKENICGGERQTGREREREKANEWFGNFDEDKRDRFIHESKMDVWKDR